MVLKGTILELSGKILLFTKEIQDPEIHPFQHRKSVMELNQS